jgi:2-C-methyl-D-erythritol 2,4-cyclodiphosphate synthase
MMRIGHGYDAHRLTAGRRLILGGVDIPCKSGLLGHSDADVVAHALIDALLGAAALGDIGKMFPDSEEKYKDAHSIGLLEIVSSKISDAGYAVENVDITVVAQETRLAPYIQQMRGNIAGALGIDKGKVSVKATTEERLGFTGRLEGISAHAVCLITER